MASFLLATDFVSRLPQMVMFSFSVGRSLGAGWLCVFRCGSRR